jgi:hypothetical protein
MKIMPRCRQCRGNTVVSVRQAADLHKKLFENANSDWRANDIAQKVAEEKQREMDLLLNRYLPRTRCYGSAWVTVFRIRINRIRIWKVKE